jgi:MinD superfamily P-loop ATPase
MRIAIASGKGGTGKTTVALCLAQVAGRGTRLLDCDVEAPNCHLFLRPDHVDRQIVGIPVPQVDTSRCTACGECGQFCQFNAIVSFKTEPLLFPELCHGCGGCVEVCPERAIREVRRPIGVIERGDCAGIELVQGRLNVGEPLAPPLVRAVKSCSNGSGVTLIDSPPGTSCTMIEAVRGCDYVVLVTEPTPFGLRDLKLAAAAVRMLRIQFGVVVNRVGIGDDRVQEYCRACHIPLLLEIADDRRIAEAYSRGETTVDSLPAMYSSFDLLFHRVDSECHRV